ncbi:fumarate hydratase class I, aerobic [Desulfosporosinus acididurans]|uniref:Fumarate hydratase class I, aerobic n=1 Tax=Desulfosporosinus acididurans TaxID=476652 RepID=A0A0J1FMX7_9FIRM|nr:Fe-S-containing hydro-lyase [Desulfosporosinus acididurans]KLU64859.1 fumarate hydratase class I, aerobic [Desulfosporosinus acididurans]
MTEVVRIETPLTHEKAAQLKSGDNVLLSGVIYTGRDAAHKKMVEALARGEELPFNVKDQIIFFVGPTPPKPGQVIGSAGPTTSYRMDAYSPTLIERGLTGMIGKGLRSAEVVDAMKRYGAVYFGAIGGLGALLAKRIVAAEVIAYPELGPEAVRRLEVKDFPIMVIIDQEGNNLYEIGKAKYRTI